MTQVLEMLENGQISVEEAIGLMSTKEQPTERTERSEPANTRRWLRVRVTDLKTGRGKVNVNLPLGWMRFGLAMGARFVPELEELDFEELIAAYDESDGSPIVEVEDIEDNERVEIYLD